ncbi:hypothetical protein [Bacillus sp. OK048]|uniref:hypothetical protein n=1 Tax=Bacillus sp. OK048 TaxID=1882761 RepID=UPI000883D0A1|nr:hypothetical protein [Bacillus sp. OK048]SDN63224.1 hypothetical protein SAMN05443253_11555 [Bacillus sp. OK048]
MPDKVLNEDGLMDELILKLNEVFEDSNPLNPKGVFVQNFEKLILDENILDYLILKYDGVYLFLLYNQYLNLITLNSKLDNEGTIYQEYSLNRIPLTDISKAQITSIEHEDDQFDTTKHNLLIEYIDFSSKGRSSQINIMDINNENVVPFLAGLNEFLIKGTSAKRPDVEKKN